ncbi:MAG: hypothetical protein A3B99_03220 [Candidatus Yanofskybacteria bacterium RIFCSPHIGHO2_02_FULL_44_12b]|uniref:Peptidase M50 domain-containing protein n=2 Tax=Candidatus Yanofskyibacteriota TaxID=1752733 RepID=A0A1F8GJN2_9BACT|nr:MAG: Peptidase M50 [Candidatus Yanofskybacteria bacterium GW2011_GWA2_44_9]OGN05317.1 MAG: hypothetical protein A2659_01795 [Candidatus Yanofskybacteria bacterium RIFCSPHIGHO2_01_FULL_44_24]OGN16297.1 MAG: hypothetical protein A3B99_03220 [Candidatus Yanofskybacteria bacterium RIFCSPHIGHO2_02_FULL_44_12b]OGN25543.1 MAG: hypothetical protein A2925_02350 [Candidatus Yanofskybacteria bacterium RIFCSPLOWO2_01_FULL_44_22]
MKLLKALAFVVVLEMAFVTHEYGHFTEMRKRNIEVAEFSLGIGPVLYQKKLSDVAVSVRAIPIMAYVAPSEKGQKKIDESSLYDRFLIHSAGVRNNFLSLMVVVLFLQVLGRFRGYYRNGLLADILILPFSITVSAVNYGLNLLTFGRVKLSDNGLTIFTGGFFDKGRNEGRISVFAVRSFLLLSLMLGAFNSFPLFPLDGGRIFIDFIRLFMSERVVSLIAFLSQPVIVMLFFMARQTVAAFDFEVKQPEDQKTPQ